MTSLLQLELAKQNIEISDVEALPSIFGAMLKRLNNLDIIVTSILKREQGAANAVDNKTTWIESYGLIEKALRTFLLNYNRVPDSTDGDHGDHHRKMLTAFDDETVPLREALGVQPQKRGLPTVPVARLYIDELRQLRNAGKHPDPENSFKREKLGRRGQQIGYRAWYSTVFEGLVQCLKTSIEVEKLGKYFRKTLGLFRCDSGTKCEREFKTYLQWKVHALREHPEVRKISGIAVETFSSQAPTIPAPIPKAASDGAGTYLEQAMKVATLAAQYVSDTVADRASQITKGPRYSSVGVSSSESDASRILAVERRSDSSKQISAGSQATPPVNIPSCQSAPRGSETMVSEHQTALQRIADLELQLARSKEDVACGKLRDASNDRALEQRDKTISEYLELLKIQESELEEAAKGKQEGFKEGKAAGEKEVWEKIDRCR